MKSPDVCSTSFSRRATAVFRAGILAAFFHLTGIVACAGPDDAMAILETVQPLASIGLSPDGRRLAFATRDGDRLILHVRDLDTGDETSFEMGTDIPTGAGNEDKTVRPAVMNYVEWATNDRVIALQRYGKLHAIDASGANKVELLPFDSGMFREGGGETVVAVRTVTNLLPGEPDTILVRGTFATFSSSSLAIAAGSVIDYYRVNIHTGRAMPFSGSSGERVRTLIDQFGRIRGAYDIDRDDGRYEILVVDESGKPKRPVSKHIGKELAEQYGLRFEVEKDIFHEAQIFGFGYNPNILFFSANSGRDTYAFYALDIEGRRVAGPLAESERFDVPVSLVYVPQKFALGGITYQAEREQTVWLLPEFAAVQRAVDASLPGRINRIIDWDDTFNRFAIVSSSDRDPGTVYVLDRAAKTMRRQLARHPTLDPEHMAQTVPAWVKTRDGREVLCYLTIPPEAKPGGSNPMVVLLHGGPWARDYWGFDSEVQYLAAHGFLVLQVNFRGSEGFGFAHLSAAFGRFGDAALEDVEDAIDWAVTYGVADRSRIFTMGASYGGYLALYLAATHPEGFRGAVSIAGVTDLLSIIEGDSYYGSPSEWVSYEVRKALIGDPRKQKALLKSTSPVNLAKKFAAPVLLIHGEDDSTVPIAHSKRLHGALKGAGKAVEFIPIKDAYHGGWNPKQERDLYESVIHFLRKNDPGPPASDPPSAAGAGGA
jgi:acetyl esterase/lipase